jgi:hypothetical protein
MTVLGSGDDVERNVVEGNKSAPTIREQFDNYVINRQRKQRGSKMRNDSVLKTVSF